MRWATSMNRRISPEGQDGEPADRPDDQQGRNIHASHQERQQEGKHAQQNARPGSPLILCDVLDAQN